MGAVHGVYLKYVAASALSLIGYNLLSSSSASSSSDAANQGMAMQPAAALRLILGYSALVNGTIAVLFKAERGMAIIGKHRTQGTIPFWSYIVFFPFHIPTIIYTHVHTRISVYKTKGGDAADDDNDNADSAKPIYLPVPVASEVQDGWWVGGCYAFELHRNDHWGGIVDLTVEFPEWCRHHTKHYLSAPTWDGVPLSPADLEAAATFATMARKDGDVLVHCAHGRGRSTTVMCACLVKAGLYPNWQDAFEKGIKPNRPVCKLNKRMRENLTAWQAEYVDGKKGS